MKKIVLAVLIAGVIAAIVFYANQPPSAAVPALVSVPIASVVSPTSKPVVSQPIMPPVVVQTKAVEPAAASVVPAPPSAAKNSSASSPRAELATAIPELVRLIDAQDFETLMQDFMPPDELNALLANAGPPGQPMPISVLASHMTQNPKVMQQMERASQFLKYLQTQTPVMDASGESASYSFAKPLSNGQNSIDFVKVAGNWYVKNGVQFFR